MNETKVYARRVNHYVLNFDRDIVFHKKSEWMGLTCLQSVCEKYYVIVKIADLSRIGTLDEELVMIHHNVTW